MESQPSELSGGWPSNYFNYFTETEDHFRRARGSGLFLLSPLDWALIESWKNAGIPLDAVLRGIDASFEKWRSKKSKTQAVNSLAYCAQAIGKEAETIARGGTRVARGSAAAADAPFSTDELASYFRKNAADLEAQGYGEIAAAISKLAGDADSASGDLEDLERRLTALEEKLIATARSRQSEEAALAARRELDLQLRPHRSKMTADQLSMLERQFLDRKLLESAGLPRLSLFYMR